AVAVRELDLVCARRQAVLQKPLEHELAEATTRLRRAKQVLQRADVLRKITDTHALLSERAKLSREIRERPLRRRRLRDERLLRRAERALHLATQLAHELRVPQPRRRPLPRAVPAGPDLGGRTALAGALPRRRPRATNCGCVVRSHANAHRTAQAVLHRRRPAHLGIAALPRRVPAPGADA